MRRKEPFPLHKIDEIRHKPDNFRLLEKVPFLRENQIFPYQINEQSNQNLMPILFLDTETTGLLVEQDSIIELGIVRAEYNSLEERIVSVQHPFSMLEEPENLIPEHITQLTGIDNSMVQHKRIDDGQVERLLDGDPLIIAHNAAFDRPFFEKRFSNHTCSRWACSLKEVNWRKLGFNGSSLEYILMQLGWFYEGHRAQSDCLAIAWLFYSYPDLFRHLLHTSEKNSVLVQAFGAPYKVKDQLKVRGYRWHGGGTHSNKHWWCEVDDKNLSDEKAYLDSIYLNGSQMAKYTLRGARERFKKVV